MGMRSQWVMTLGILIGSLVISTTAWPRNSSTKACAVNQAGTHWFVNISDSSLREIATQGDRGMRVTLKRVRDGLKAARDEDRRFTSLGFHWHEKNTMDCKLFGVVTTDAFCKEGFETTETFGTIERPCGATGTKLRDAVAIATSRRSTTAYNTTYGATLASRPQVDLIRDILVARSSRNARSDFEKTKIEFFTKGYSVKTSDTMSEIAYQMTGTASAWRVLYEFNKVAGGIRDPNMIFPGKKIKMTPELASKYVVSSTPVIPYKVESAATLRDITSKLKFKVTDSRWGLNLLNTQLSEGSGEKVRAGATVWVPAGVGGWQKVRSHGEVAREVSKRIYGVGTYAILIATICPNDFSRNEGTCVLPEFEVKELPWLNTVGKNLVTGN